MSIAAICQRKVITIDTGASLRDAATLMRAQHVGALVVTVEGSGHEKAVGMITDRDPAIEILVRDDLDPAGIKVGQVASRHLASVPGSAGIGEAVAVMREAGVRRLLVTEDEGELAGFVSADDLLQAPADRARRPGRRAAQRDRARRCGAPVDPAPAAEAGPLALRRAGHAAADHDALNEHALRSGQEGHHGAGGARRLTR